MTRAEKKLIVRLAEQQIATAGINVVDTVAKTLYDILKAMGLDSEAEEVYEYYGMLWSRK